MDQREKIDDFEETLRVAIRGLLLDVMTCMPAQVVSWDSVHNTAVVQPVLKTRVRGSDGSVTWVQPKPLVDCPVVFVGGGGWTATFPIKPGDECLVIFASRQIDTWFQAGGIQQRTDLRSHDPSDGFVLIGPRNQTRTLTNINPDAMELRSDDGKTSIGLGLDGVITIKAPGGVIVHGQVTADELGTTQIPTPSATAANLSIPFVVDGQTIFLKASSTE